MSTFECTCHANEGSNVMRLDTDDGFFPHIYGVEYKSKGGYDALSIAI